MMYHIPDVLSTDQVAEFTRQLAQAEWVDGRVTVGSQGAAVKQNQQIDTRTPLYARLQAAVLDMLRGHPQFFFRRAAADESARGAVAPHLLERTPR